MDATSWNHLPDTAIIGILRHLSHQDRAQASSTCKSWRDCYFHPIFWRRVNLSLSIRTGCQPACCILDKCGKFVRELTVAVKVPCQRVLYVNGQFLSVPRSSTGLSTCSDESLLTQLPEDECPKYEAFYQELPKVFDGLSISQGLEKLILSFFPYSGLPVSPDTEFELKMVDSLMKVIEASSRMKAIALSLKVSLSLQSKFLKALSEKFHKQLQVLHIPAFLGSGDLSEIGAMTSSLLRFTTLSVLTLNTSLVTNQLIQTLLRSVEEPALRQLNLVAGFGTDTFISVDDACWTKLTRRCPDFRVTMSAVISGDNTVEVLLACLTPNIPLSSLRIFVCHPCSLKVELIEAVAEKYHERLSRLELYSDRTTVLFGNEAGEDPFVMLCWKCKKLNHIVIKGYKVLACNILAIALLRGPSLVTMEVAGDLMYHHDEVSTDEYEDETTPTSYDSLTSETEDWFAFQLEHIQKISKSLKRPWAPVKRRHMNLSEFLSQDLYIDAS